MTDQHPLTDEIIRSLEEKWVDDFGCVIYSEDDWRRAADWQLEQVKEKVREKLREWRLSGYGAGADAAEDFFEEVIAELRPQQQPENNQ